MTITRSLRQLHQLYLMVSDYCANVCGYNSVNAGDEKKRLDFMKSLGATIGAKHTVDRKNIYADVIKLYQDAEVIKECPIFIAYRNEKAIDDGGVTRDMLSAFWQQAYQTLFDGATTLVPLVHPSTDMDVFPVIGKIISHGYLAGGTLPVRISLPSLLAMFTVDIPRSFLLDALLDFVSNNERKKLKSALNFKGKAFGAECLSELVSILSRLGCRQLPNPSNLAELILQVARYEFLKKPMGAIAMVHSGIPSEHREFWNQLCIEGIAQLYFSMTMDMNKILLALQCDSSNQAEERTFGYLHTMIGNMGTNELQNFLRFTTGSSVFLSKKIKVLFNDTSGLGRRLFASTCSSTLYLPVSYSNYNDFFSEWAAILNETDQEWKWRMDAY